MTDETFKRRFESRYREMYQASPNEFHALDFVGAIGCMGDALLDSRLFLPEFVEVDNLIFLREVLGDFGGEDALRLRVADFEAPREAEECSNAFEISLNFPNQRHRNAPGDERLLAEQLAVAWGLRLQQCYPARAFLAFLIGMEPG